MVKCLEAEGVDILFGYPGAAICPFYDALYDSPIRHVLVRSEQNAAHMASGYARASGRPGVCVATSGPGATNLITGIATAYMDSIPIIAITGQVNLEQLGRDVFQEADITGACESFTKHSYLVKSVEDLPRVFKEAFHIASTGRPCLLYTSQLLDSAGLGQCGHPHLHPRGPGLLRPGPPVGRRQKRGVEPGLGLSRLASCVPQGRDGLCEVGCR